MPWPYTFASLSGDVPAAYLDSNFAAAAFAADLDALEVAVAALPSGATPAAPTPGGSAGVAATLSRGDHAHPPQPATINLQTGTTYTLQSSDDGKVVELSNTSSITVTVPNSLAQGFSCLIVQVNTGQVTIAAGADATQRQRLGLNKTAGQWGVVSMYVRANVGGTAAEYVLGGDMTS